MYTRATFNLNLNLRVFSIPHATILFPSRQECTTNMYLTIDYLDRSVVELQKRTKKIFSGKIAYAPWGV